MIDEKPIKLTALYLAIRSNSGNSYDDEGRMVINPDKILEAAKKFGAYLKEESK